MLTQDIPPDRFRLMEYAPRDASDILVQFAHDDGDRNEIVVAYWEERDDDFPHGCWKMSVSHLLLPGVPSCWWPLPVAGQRWDTEQKSGLDLLVGEVSTMREKSSQ